jgi:hypothetical protein
MTEKELYKGLAEIVRKTIEIQEERLKDTRSGKFRYQMIKEGHFNGKILNPSNMFNCNVKVFIRLLLNLASEVEKEVFIAMIVKIGELLFKIGNDEKSLNDINDSHARKS